MVTPITPPAAQLESVHRSHSNQSKSSPNAGIASQPGVSDSHHRTDSFEIFDSILQKAYRKMTFSPDAPSALAPDSGHNSSVPDQAELTGYKTVEKITAQQASDSILNFIKQRLQADTVNGADKGELLERLDHGLKGFELGFSQAKEEIEALGLLSPKLSGQINETYKLVTSGIDQIRESIEVL